MGDSKYSLLKHEEAEHTDSDSIVIDGGTVRHNVNGGIRHPVDASDNDVHQLHPSPSHHVEAATSYRSHKKDKKAHFYDIKKRYVVAELWPVIFLAITIFVLRYVCTNPNTNIATEEQMKIPTPPFCTSVKPEYGNKLFYYDMGGTYCVGERQWNVREYWEKTLSGMAFNFPHLIDGFVFTLAIGNFPLILFGIVGNEWLEELVVATSQHWGFNFDPAYDLEPRYDSLMRDIIHAGLGTLLAAHLRRILLIPPWCAWPPHCDAFKKPGSDKHSTVRWLKVVISLVVFWQLMLLYNADGGLFSFSLNNTITTMCIALWFTATYFMNRHDFPELPPLRVASWHICGGALMILGISLSIYAPKPTIYLIMLFEGVCKLCLLAIELAVTSNFLNIKNRFALSMQCDETSSDVIERDPMLRYLIDKMPQLDTTIQQNISNYLEEDLRRQEYARHPFSSSRSKLTFVTSFIAGCCFLILGIWEPLTYKGTLTLGGDIVNVAYARHWCGNPNGPIYSVNTCRGIYDSVNQ